MRAPGFALGEWLRRLGVRRPEWSPDVSETVSPVLLVGDQSAYTPRARVARGYSQAYTDPADLGGPPARFAGALFQARSSGGVELLVTSSQATGDGSGIASPGFPYLAFTFLDAPPTGTITNSANRIESSDPDHPCVSLVQSWRSTAGVAILTGKNNRPLLFGGAHSAQAAPAINFQDSPGELKRFYLPPGRILFLEAYTQGIDTVFNFDWIEYPTL